MHIPPHPLRCRLMATRPAYPPMPTLRNACDACTAAKVKCSQGRPQCKRCEHRGFLCQYSISLRATKSGRRPSSISSSVSSPFNSTTGSTHHESQRPLDDVSMTSSSAKSANLAFSDAFNQISSTFDDDSVIPSFFDDWDTDDTDMNFQTDFSEGNEDTIPFFPNFINLSQGRSSPKVPQPTKVAQQGFNAYSNSNNNENNNNDNNNESSHVNNLVAKTTSLLPFYRPRADFPPPDPPPPTRELTPTPSSVNAIALAQTCQCQHLILSKLSEISRRRTDHAIPFDQCLSENKSVIMLSNTIVNCSNPNHDDDLVLMLTHLALITHVILFFDHPLGSEYETVDSSSEDSDTIQASSGVVHHVYRQSRKKQQSQRASSRPQTFLLNDIDSGNHHPHSKKQQQQQQQSALPRARLSLGTYELDTHDEQILQRNLLRIELCKIRKLMEAFERRFYTLERMNGGVFRSGAAGMGGEHGDRGVKSHVDDEEKPLSEIIAWLKRRLRRNYEALAHLGGIGM